MKITLEKEIRCECCNKIIRLVFVTVETGDPTPDLQTFDEVCDKCQDDEDY